MKTLTVKLYSYSELSPEARSRVIRDRIKDAENDEMLLTYQMEEMADSLKAIAEAGDLTLTNWCFGPYERNYCADVRGHAADLEGGRALAWFARVLIAAGHPRPKTMAGMTFPGVCGFTGVCYDDDIAESVWRGLIDGMTVKDAFTRAAQKLCHYCEKELDYLMSEDAVMETLDETAEEYTEAGEKY